MLLLAIVVVVVVAVGAGIAANYFSSKPADEGATVPQVLSATGLIAAFLLAIVLSGAATSYSAAQKAAKQEADVIDTLFESANYVDMPYRQRIQAAAVCYARAVIGPEWRALAGGKTSPVPSNWTGTKPIGLRAQFLEMTPRAQGFSLVQSADAQRGGLRTERVTQANPTMATAVVWFLAVLIALSLGGLAYSVPRAKNKAQLAALVVVVVTFICAMGLVYNLDRPFSGVLALSPTAMEETEADAAEDYIDEYQVDAPCDEEGNPNDDTTPVAVAASATPSTTTTVG